jgi:hypothetical protein
LNVATLTTVILRPTVCRICGHEFKGDSLKSATIIGNNPQARMQQIQALLSPLMKHLQKKHPEQLQWTQLQGGEYAGLLALNLIQCDEPEIERQRDQTRWKIHQMTRRVAITDERIEERLKLAYLTALAEELKMPVGELNPASADPMMTLPSARHILRTMREMRDVLEERGRYEAFQTPKVQNPPPAENSPNMTPGS